MAEEATGGAVAGSLEASAARRDRVAGPGESEPDQQLATTDQPGTLGETPYNYRFFVG